MGLVELKKIMSPRMDHTNLVEVCDTQKLQQLREGETIQNWADGEGVWTIFVLQNCPL